MPECIWAYLTKLVLEEEILSLSLHAAARRGCSKQKDEFTCLESCKSTLWKDQGREDTEVART